MTLLITRTFAYLKMKEGKELAASPKHRNLKVCDDSISSVAASELVLSHFIRRGNIENTPMVNRNKSERDLTGCFSATAKKMFLLL